MNHFNIREMSCKDGTKFPVKWLARWEKLLRVLNTIREAWGGPIVIVSGYRSPEYNRKIGGARASQHMEGRAADLRPGQVDKRKASELHAMILAMYGRGEVGDLGGLGEYPTFAHIDTRVGGTRLARWSGSRVES